MYFSIDRIYEEQKIVVLIDDNKIKSEISADSLPADIKEGLILYFDGGSYVIDYDQTEKVKANLKERLEKLFKKN